MDQKIQLFIKEQKNLTLCTSIDDTPYCANCFYAFLHDNYFLVFKSNRNTMHITNALVNNKVAGTILPDISKIGIIKGIQFTGRLIVLADSEFLEKAKRNYYSQHPFALPMPGELWGVELHSIKMTDNKLGFGKKLLWERSIK